MNTNDFAHREFSADNWEHLVKDYINTLECHDNQLWYKKGEQKKKISEELITLGYYVKYKYGSDPEVSFRLNQIKDAPDDGWVYKSREILESVQIVIAYYDKEESEEDRKLMNGEDVVIGGWGGERMKLLEQRIKKRIKKKIEEKKYQNIDVLLVGVKDWFIRRTNDEYNDLQQELSDFVRSVAGKSQFREFVIVDTDLVGRGGLRQFPNKAN
jgi:hypothetical protein